MSILESIILGIIEGMTEFLPISSTFHLIFASQVLKTKGDDFCKLFNVFIQSGAILSVLILYSKNLKRDFELIKKTLMAFFPTAVLGAILYKTIKQKFFESYFSMTSVFILIGVLFLVFEILVKKNVLNPRKTISELAYGDAFLIGLLQALAFLPGVSRAGAVILVMMFLGYRRSDSAYFSFILAIPTIFSAGLYDLFRTQNLVFNSRENLLLLLLGFFTALVIAYFAVKWFISYLQRHTLNLFAAYRLILGLVIFILIF